jgi:sec-independent protein translocase protein TatB
MGSPPPILVSTISMPDTLILMVLALVVFGPRRLPKIGRQIGKLMYEFRKASNDFKFQMEEELRQAEEAERRQKEEQERQRALAAAPPAPQLEQTNPQTAEPPSAPEPQAAVPETNENSYSNETSYNDLVDERTRPEEVTQPTADAAAPPVASEAALPAEQESIPRIQPPSTGEKVAAERPGAKPQQQELFAEDEGKAPEGVTPETERSEPAAHHG